MEKEINYQSISGSQIKAFIAKPETASGKLPAVVLIHEIFGLDEHFRDLSRRLAKEGYLVITPHLFSGDLEKIADPYTLGTLMPLLRTLPREHFGNPEKINEVSASLAEQDRQTFQILMNILAGKYDQRFVDDLKRAYDFIAEKENANPAKVASLGFCFGGGMSGLLACSDSRFAAHVVFYGKRPPADKIEFIKAPVLGIYGSLDGGITPSIAGLSEEMKKAGKNFEFVIYEGANHAFFNDTRKQVYDQGAATAAWGLVKTFLKKNL